MTTITVADYAPLSAIEIIRAFISKATWIDQAERNKLLADGAEESDYSSVGLVVNLKDGQIDTTAYNKLYGQHNRAFSIAAMDHDPALTIIQRLAIATALATLHKVSVTDIQLSSHNNSLTQIDVTKSGEKVSYSVSNAFDKMYTALKDPATKDEQVTLHQNKYRACCAPAQAAGNPLSAINLMHAINQAAADYKEFSINNRPTFVFVYRNHGSKGRGHVATLVKACEGAELPAIHTALKIFFGSRVSGTLPYDSTKPGSRDHSFVSFLLDELAKFTDLKTLGLGDFILPEAKEYTFTASAPENVKARKDFIAAMPRATLAASAELSNFEENPMHTSSRRDSVTTPPGENAGPKGATRPIAPDNGDEKTPLSQRITVSWQKNDLSSAVK